MGRSNNRSNCMNVIIRGCVQRHRTVTFDAVSNSVLLIEQRLLPHEFRIVPARDYGETARAIREMVVRGCRLEPREDLHQAWEALNNL